MLSNRDSDSATAKHEVVHAERSPQVDGQVQHASADEHTFDIDSDELPPGYFKSPFFIGSMMGIGLGLMAGVAGYGYAAPILMIINNDIGPV